MDDDDWVETQWTGDARERYAASAEELITEIRRHVDLTLSREGRQRELADYFPSAAEVAAAADRFNDAELDWCGSSALPLRLSDEGDEEDDDEFEEELSGDVLTVLGRFDFRLTDPEAFIAAGRRAYAETWPEDTEEDAELAVADIFGAVNELMHPPSLTQVEDAPGVESERVWVETYMHDGSATDDEDAFAILGG